MLGNGRSKWAVSFFLCKRDKAEVTEKWERDEEFKGLRTHGEEERKEMAQLNIVYITVGQAGS